MRLLNYATKLVHRAVGLTKVYYALWLSKHYYYALRLTKDY